MSPQSTAAGQLDLLLLAVISRGPIHGYAIIEALRIRSSGAFDLPEGTVYPALYRMERTGLLRSRTKIVEGRSRRLYELTAPGREAILERRRSWERLASGMTAVLGGK
jgi:PadR family transcriptional regulator, regulatory protein PadR